jgi:hypothetical protein
MADETIPQSQQEPVGELDSYGEFKPYKPLGYLLTGTKFYAAPPNTAALTAQRDELLVALKHIASTPDSLYMNRSVLLWDAVTVAKKALALTPADAKAKLRELMLEVAREVNQHVIMYHPTFPQGPLNGSGLDTIVDKILEN